MAAKSVLHSTTTRALADTVIDAARSCDGSASLTSLDVSRLPEVGDLVGGVYRLTRLLGKGTFGMVYVAERIDVPEHRAAMKVTLREAYSGRDVERELSMLASASHPHMVQLKDHGVTTDYVWFTMPVYDGETLASRLHRGTLSLAEAHEVFVPIAQSLEALHRAGLRHQDLKPENVFLAEFGGRLHPIILDLGVAAECTSKFVAGTILFASPEQIGALTRTEADAHLDEKMDTYGLAATLLLSLVGMEYFPGGNAGTHEEMVAAQQQRANRPLHPDALPELTGRPRKLLEDAFKSWFAENASARPSMTKMADGLGVLREKEREAKRVEERMRAIQKTKFVQMRVAVIVLVLVALAFLGVVFAERETIRLAAQLEEVRAEERQSFDSLQSCESAQTLCQKQLLRDQANYQETLDQLTKSNDRTRSERDERANQLILCSTRLRAAEEEAEATANACGETRSQAVYDLQSQLRTVTDERDTLAQQAAEQEQHVAQAQRKIGECEADLASWKGERSVTDNPYSVHVPTTDPPASSTLEPLPHPSAPVERPSFDEDGHLVWD